MKTNTIFLLLSVATAAAVSGECDGDMFVVDVVAPAVEVDNER